MKQGKQNALFYMKQYSQNALFYIKRGVQNALFYMKRIESAGIKAGRGGAGGFGQAIARVSIRRFLLRDPREELEEPPNHCIQPAGCISAVRGDYPGTSQ